MCVGAPHLNTFPYISSILLPTSFPHTPTHFPTHPIHSPTPSPHFSTPHTSFLTSPHTPTHFPTSPPYISSHSSPDLPLHLNILPYSPHALSHTSPHILPHSFDYVAKLPCDDVTLNQFNSKSPIKFFTATGNSKSCFGVSNENFRCRKVWRSYHVAKLLATSTSSRSHYFVIIIILVLFLSTFIFFFCFL